jgi:hypothetical protein
MAASPITHCTLRVLPLVIVPAAILIGGPWLKAAAGPVATLIAGGVAAVFMVVYANYLAFLVQRRQDEVQQASTGFAAQWGMAAGQAVFVALLVMPGFTDFVAVTVRDMAGRTAPDGKLVVLAMTAGFCALVLLQSIGSVVMRAVWWRAKR